VSSQHGSFPCGFPRTPGACALAMPHGADAEPGIEAFPRQLDCKTPPPPWFASSPPRRAAPVGWWCRGSGKKPKPKDLPSPIRLDPQSHVQRFLGRFPSGNGKKCPIQKHPHGTPHLKAFPAKLPLVLVGDFHEAGDALGGVECAMNPFPETRRSSGCLENQNRFGGNFQRGPLARYGRVWGWKSPFRTGWTLRSSIGPTKVRRSQV